MIKKMIAKKKRAKPRQPESIVVQQPILHTLRVTKAHAAQAEINATTALVSVVQELTQRVAALEKRAGVPGPKGDKGDPGVGFWG